MWCVSSVLSIFDYPWKHFEQHWLLLLRQHLLQQFVQFCWTSHPLQILAGPSQNLLQLYGINHVPIKKSKEKIWGMIQDIIILQKLTKSFRSPIKRKMLNFITTFSHGTDFEMSYNICRHCKLWCLFFVQCFCFLQSIISCIICLIMIQNIWHSGVKMTCYKHHCI